MGAVITTIANGIGRPGCTRGGDGGVNTFVGIDSGIGKGANRVGRVQYSADKLVGQTRKP